MKQHWFPIALGILILVVVIDKMIAGYAERQEAAKTFREFLAGEREDTLWRGAGRDEIPYYTDSGKLIRYGRELISNTAYYIGPQGIVAHTANGMNCQNCHLDGGTLPFANNFGKVYATYPQFRTRCNAIQGINGRINDCFERSLDGSPLDTNSREMKAIYAYIKWLGEDVPKGVIRGGTVLARLAFPDSAANPHTGKQVYMTKCQSCHGENGQGQAGLLGVGYSYPPLWGPHSYNDGAGLYRLGSFADYVKNNMPFGASYREPRLTDEEAWDVAAFVNSQPRPHMDQGRDWKQIDKKPIDFPFGPYADTFSEHQHKYGPFKPIKQAQKNKQ